VAESPDLTAGDAPELTLAQVAARAHVSPATVKRWVQMGLVPEYAGHWTPEMVAYVRIVARLRARGHTLEQIKLAGENGQLVTGPIETLLNTRDGRHSLRQASRESGLKREMIERIYASMGMSAFTLEPITDDDLQMLKYAAAVLDSGFPQVALLQLLRVYGQALAQIADAEVRLFHLYVHEPLMREGVAGGKIAQEMEGLTRELLPFAAPLMNYLHDRLLGHFVEQDVIGHMEADLGHRTLAEGRLRVVIAFADLAGYARLTVERGDEEALGTVERFVEAVEQTLPVDARVIKTLGDEVMVVGSDPAALVKWAVDLSSELPPEEPPPRIGLHYGEALYRDGDYYGRDVNQAARVVARAGGGEVLVTRPVVDMAAGAADLEFDRIGEVGLKGFSEPTELFIASARAH
jgi:adenylate cyclase